jgi:hypothetical protein
MKISPFEVPAPVHILLQYLWEHDAFRVEGIFRISGSFALSESIVASLNEGEDFFPNLGDSISDIHTVANILKRYFRQLPSPLLPLSIFPQEMTIESAHQMISELDPLPRELCVRLFGFLRQVASHESESLMGAENLARVWSVALLGDTAQISEVLDRVGKLHQLFSNIWA